MNDWNTNMEKLPKPLQRCMMALLLEVDESIVHSITDEIVKAITSERTRLLSVESMKMEKISGYCYQSRRGCSCGHIARNKLRQSILSDMEKGSV